VKLLFARNVNLNTEDNEQRTPLIWAASNRRDTVARLLLEKDSVTRDPKDKSGRTPLSLAAENGDEAIVRLLLGKDDVSRDNEDKNGRTPFSWAAENGREAIVSLLLDNVDPDRKDNDDRTPLSWAAENGHEKIVKLLLKKEVDLESCDSGMHTPLWWAASKDHLRVTKLLIEDGHDKITLCTLAKTQTQETLRIVKFLLGAGYKVNTTDSWKRTPLHYAAKFDNLGVAQELARPLGRIDFNAEDDEGMTPLRFAIERQKPAIERQKPEFITWLLQNGAHTEGISRQDWLAAYGETASSIVNLSGKLVSFEQGFTGIPSGKQRDLETRLL
jgi:ankyrin repeat protein